MSTENSPAETPDTTTTAENGDAANASAAQSEGGKPAGTNPWNDPSTMPIGDTLKLANQMIAGLNARIEKAEAGASSAAKPDASKGAAGDQKEPVAAELKDDKPDDSAALTEAKAKIEALTSRLEKLEGDGRSKVIAEVGVKEKYRDLVPKDLDADGVRAWAKERPELLDRAFPTPTEADLGGGGASTTHHQQPPGLFATAEVN